MSPYLVAEQMPYSGPKYPKTSYRPEIDGLRALAVIAVIINHFNRDALPSGYLGVDIFFVISGFVITSSLASRPSKGFGDFLISFYTRRVKRLVPALLLFVIPASILICLFNPIPDTSLKTGFTSLFGLANLWLYKINTGYASPSAELNIFTHTWSLGVEEQFYFLFPFLVWFTGFSRSTSRGSRNLLIIMVALFVASLSLFIYLYGTNEPAAYYLMPSRLWEAGTGCLLFLSLQHSKKFVRILRLLSPLVITVALVVVLFVPPQFPVLTTIGVVGLTAALIACLRPGTTAHKLFAQQRIVYIGLISYSIYLWHWGILVISRWTIGIHWWSVPVQLALILLLSAASYHYVERPLRYADWCRFRWQSILYGLGASASVAGLQLILIYTPNFSLYAGSQELAGSLGSGSLKNKYVLEEVNSEWGGEDCVLDPDMDKSQIGKEISIERCTLGNFSEAKKRILVLGHSVSASFTQAFDELVVRDGYAVTITSAFGVPLVKVPTTDGLQPLADYYWDSVIPTLVDQLKPGDWVFLASSHGMPEDLLEDGLRGFSDDLSDKGIRLAKLNAIPGPLEGCEPLLIVREWFRPSAGDCKMPSREQFLSRRDLYDEMLTSLEAEGKLHVVDLLDLYCPGTKCTFFASNGQMLFRDSANHPSVEAARMAAPIIREVLISP